MPDLMVEPEHVDGIGVDSSPLAASAALVTFIDPTLGIAELLVQLGVGAAVLLATIWLGRVLWREKMLRHLGRQFPDLSPQFRQSVRRAPLLRAPKAPADPYARTHHVVVDALGDGRPGESFWAPGPSTGMGELGPDGSRTDATVKLTAGVTMLVVCLGRIGTRTDGFEVLRAAERVHVARSRYTAQVALGPVDQVPTAAGTGWRTTCQWTTGRALTDTHIDVEDWAFIIGVLSTSWHARAVEALDAILTTWRWIPDLPAAPDPSGS